MRADGLSTRVGANNPQYAVPGNPSSRQSVNSIPSPSGGPRPNAKSRAAILRGLLQSREAKASRTGGAGQSAARPTTRESSASSATSPTEGRGFTATPHRSTGGIAGKTFVRPAGENSTPPFRPSGSVGSAGSPFSAPAFRGTQNFEAPGTEEKPDAFAAGRKSQRASHGMIPAQVMPKTAGKPIGPFGRRNGTGVRAPRYQNAGGDDQSTR